MHRVGLRIAACVSVILILALPSRAQFTLLAAGMVNVRGGAVAWGDYDGDGDLDVVLAGTEASGPITSLYRNDGGGVFTEVVTNLPGLCWCDIAWGDYDNDGDLDLAASGIPVGTSASRVSKILRNDGGGAFTDINAPLTADENPIVAWGDYDNDGDLDLAIADGSYSATTEVYRNDGSDRFVKVAGLYGSTAAWGDFDRDGDLDIAPCNDGSDGILWLNDMDRGFRSVVVPTRGYSGAWGDYDNDGDPDLATAGGYYNPGIWVYRNSNGNLVNVYAPPNGVFRGRVVWGDYDGDGDLDLATTGTLRIYRNDAGTFSDADAGFTDVTAQDIDWGDFDNDGRLDLAVIGVASDGTPTTRIYKNTGSAVNEPPSAPSGLAAYRAANEITFTWAPSTDDHTWQQGLTYNIRVGTTESGGDIVGPMSLPSGFRQVPGPGNARSRLYRIVGPITSTTGYWSVQAIDASGAASPWAPPLSLPGARRTVSGHVYAVSGEGVPGVKVCSGQGRVLATTDSSGYYSISVSDGWSGSLRLSIYSTYSPAKYDIPPVGPSVKNRDFTVTYYQIDADLPVVDHISVSWGDCDNDGDLDLAAMTAALTGVHTVKVYVNNSGVFQDSGLSLTDTGSGVTWGDYDRDGDLDLTAGKLYRNDGGLRFTEITGLTCSGCPAWLDHDNDGDLDFCNNSVYRNDGGDVFTTLYLNAPYKAATSVGDYDADGDMDLAAGATIFRNQRNGPFSPFNIATVEVDYGHATDTALGDYDGDGDLDLVAADSNSVRIFRNDGNDVFTNINVPIPMWSNCRVAWGDCDNDGDLDLAVGHSITSFVFRNDGGDVFTDMGLDLPEASGAVAWGDFDSDGRLDLALAGKTMRIIRNVSALPNTPPSVPTGLTAYRAADEIKFSWSAATDDHTSAVALTYNIRVGTTPGGSEICGAMSTSSGLRKVAESGNAGARLSWTLGGITAQNVYWSVQAVDSSLAGSGWAPEANILPVTRKVLGRVRAVSGEGLPGFKIISGYWNELAVSGPDGSFEFTVSNGWGGTIRLAGYVTYLPWEQTLPAVTADTEVQEFVVSLAESDIPLPALHDCSLAWADYDSDGDLDLLVTGYTPETGVVTTLLLRNDNGSFVEVADNFVDVHFALVGWCDYDNDGDLDLAINGSTSAPPNIRIYRNDGNDRFTDVSSGLPTAGVYRHFAWGDFNGDGLTDLAVDSDYAIRILRNNGNDTFAVATTIPCYGAVACSDYNGDGRLDLAVCHDGPYDRCIELYRNDGDNVFTKDAVLDTTSGTALAWVDYDNDGDPDLSAAFTNPDYTLRLYRNDGGGAFTAVPGSWLRTKELAWGDYDGDGDPDLETNGSIYRNDRNGVFTDINAGLMDQFGDGKWGDYDNDGRLELVRMGHPSHGEVTAQIYRNYEMPNTPPSPPSGLSASAVGNDLTFSYGLGSDDTTPASGLSYNIRVGTQPGGSDVFSGMALSDGRRLLPASGNVSMSRTWKMTLPVGSYYWSVQSIDQAYAGSPWAPDARIDVLPVPVSEAKLLGNGAAVTVQDNIVTAVFGEIFYIESPDRSSGIRVEKTGHTAHVGDVVQVAGVVRTNAAGELYLDGGSLTTNGAGTVEPLLVTSKALGGGSFGAQSGIEDGTGLNNIGLLVKLAGRYRWTGADTFTVDDGSGVTTKCIVPAGIVLSPYWTYVAVTGVSSCEKDTNGGVQRVLRVRGTDDIEVILGELVTISGSVYNTGGRYSYSLVSYSLESPHPAPANYTNFWSIEGPSEGVRIRVHFTDLQLGYTDYAYVTDADNGNVQRFTNCSYPDGLWSSWISGPTLRVHLYAGSSTLRPYGFSVDAYEAEFNNPLSGARLTLEPGGITATSGPDGAYTFSGIPAGTYTVSPSYAGALFSPSSRTVTMDYGLAVTDVDFTRQ